MKRVALLERNGFDRFLSYYHEIAAA